MRMGMGMGRSSSLSLGDKLVSLSQHGLSVSGALKLICNLGVEVYRTQHCPKDLGTRAGSNRVISTPV